jgi:hypothetical protein
VGQLERQALIVYPGELRPPSATTLAALAGTLARWRSLALAAAQSSLGAQRPGLPERSEAPGDRPGGPDDNPGASVSERPGLLRAKLASSGTSRPKLAGVNGQPKLAGVIDL